MHKRWLIPFALVVAALSLAAVAAACGGGGGEEEPTATVSAGPTPTAAEGQTPAEGTPAEGSTIGVNLYEYVVDPDAASAPAGQVTFNARNIGGTDHELVLIKTDLPEDALPIASDGSVDETADGLEVIDSTAEIAPNGDESLTANLDPGNYVLICNIVQTAANGSIVAHYAQGMHIAFEVTQ